MTSEPKLPTVITETEGEWARDAAYALDHLSDPSTFVYEHNELGWNADTIRLDAESSRDVRHAMAMWDGLIGQLAANFTFQPMPAPPKD